jgi:hypothetical protein
MTATCSSMAIVKHEKCFFVSETSVQDEVYTSLIKCIIDYEIIISLMAYTSTLIMRSRGGELQSLEIDKYIFVPGIEDVIKKISPLIGDSLDTTSPDSTGSF